MRACLPSVVGSEQRHANVEGCRVSGVKSYVKNGVRRVVRLVVNEIDAERARRAPSSPASSDAVAAAVARVEQALSSPISIDVGDVLAQLGDQNWERRKQMLHFLAWNHRWVASLTERNRRAAADTYDFVEERMPDAVFHLDQMAILESRASELDIVRGSILDMGVYKGASTRRLARIFPTADIHGFDSFEGLPEDWTHVLRGTFGDIAGALPDVPPSVTLHKGWFDDTLPDWLTSNGDRPIALLRIDCDIYSSTKTIFDTVGHLLVPGSFVLFDELIGYPGWRQHEFKAFEEFRTSSGLEFEYLAYGLTYTLTRVVL